MSELGRKHIQIVEAVNNAQTESEHERSKAVLQGFREALKIIAPSFGAMLMDCDNHYLEQGIDRDMCCGEFLDWKPMGIIYLTPLTSLRESFTLSALVR